MKVEMVVTDLDGTLLNRKSEFNSDDVKTLNKLKKQGIIRVIATGRSLYSLKKVVPENFPVDYILFSSGAGIIDWRKKKIIFKKYLKEQIVKLVAENLVENNVNFMVHKLIPENHKFFYYRSSKTNPDFERRIKHYKEFAEKLKPEKIRYQDSSQIIAIFNNNEQGKIRFNQVKSELDFLKVIKTTSPLDYKSLWMEIFPQNVSKGHGVEWLCEYIDIDIAKTLGVGNDYNDLDLLEFTYHSFVVDNAPRDLKNKYMSCKSNRECGFTDAINRVVFLKK